MVPGLGSVFGVRVADAKTGGVLRPRPFEGRRTLGRGSALALERPLGLADERVPGGFPLDVALASPGELAGENRVNGPDVVPFDIVLGGLARGELVALDCLPREGVPFDIVLGGLARGELVALACPALARHWSPLLARVFVVARCLCCAGCATSRPR